MSVHSPPYAYLLLGHVERVLRRPVELTTQSGHEFRHSQGWVTASCLYDMLMLLVEENGFRGIPPIAGEMRSAARLHDGRTL